MSGIKRLTPPQSRKVNALVRRTCCNYDNGNCILLDDGDECVCPQLISLSLIHICVQTPTLKMLTDRDAAISHFQKEKYYHVRLDLSLSLIHI